MTLRSGLAQQDQARKAYEDARARYRRHLRAAEKAIVNQDEDWGDEDKTARNRGQSVEILMHKSALSFSVAYAQARALGCFDEEDHVED